MNAFMPQGYDSPTALEAAQKHMIARLTARIKAATDSFVAANVTVEQDGAENRLVVRQKLSEVLSALDITDISPAFTDLEAAPVPICTSILSEVPFLKENAPRPTTTYKSVLRDTPKPRPGRPSSRPLVIE